MWCVTNGRAAAPPAIGCIVGVSTSTNPVSAMTLRNAAITFDRPRKTASDSGLLNRSTYRCRERCSTSVSPCHFSGGGSRLLPRNVSARRRRRSARRSWCSQACRRRRSSRRGRAGRRASSRASPTWFLPMKIWIAPVQSRSSRKLTFPCPRRSMIRPATRTVGPGSRRRPAPSGTRQRADLGDRPDARRTAAPRGQARGPRSCASFSCRTASRLSRDSSAITLPYPVYLDSHHDVGRAVLRLE